MSSFGLSGCFGGDLANPGPAPGSVSGSVVSCVCAHPEGGVLPQETGYEPSWSPSGVAGIHNQSEQGKLEEQGREIDTQKLLEFRP